MSTGKAPKHRVSGPFQHGDHVVRIGEGHSNLGKVRSREITVDELGKRLSKPVVDNVRHKQYLKLPKEEQDRRKNQGYWLGGPSADSRRKNTSLINRSTITLDIDAGNPELLKQLRAGKLRINRYCFFVHSTRKHTPELPRLRITIPLAKPISVEKYGAASRLYASFVDPTMDAVDDVSFRPAQMMFWPTISSDSEFVFFQNEGFLADADAVLEDFGDWQDFTKLPYSESQGQKRPTDPNRKAEDPTTKSGPVGAFCRAYDVEDAIEKFLSDKYVRGDAQSGKPRYTFLGGSTTNGAVIEDGGLFLYSHHTSDPVTDRLVNAFDLVRIHLFGDQDKDKDPYDTKPADFPSWKAMLDFVKDDEPYIRELQAERYDAHAMYFDDLGEADDVEAPAKSVPGPDSEESSEQADIAALFEDLDAAEGRFDDDVEAMLGPIPGQEAAPKPSRDTSWTEKLELTEKGGIKSNLPNQATILQHDPRLDRVVELNEFTMEVVTRRPLRSKMDLIPAVKIADRTNGDQWSDFHDTAVRMLLEAPAGKGKPGYGLKVSDRDLEAAIMATAMKCKFHPVRDYLETCEAAWDGLSRIETLFIRYLGAPDTPYVRAVARIFCLAAVVRIFEPGHKFDFVVILQGLQGKRKSTFIKILACMWFAELEGNFDDRRRLVEQMQGAWILEIPELSSFSRSEVNTIKAFVSATSDKVRLAYARRAVDFKRQCVFMGSTNEVAYLMDLTGGRRFWPVECLLPRDVEIDTDALSREVSQIWGEAVHLYRSMRAKQPRGVLPLYLTDSDAKAEAMERQENARVSTEVDAMAGVIQAWADVPVSAAKLAGVDDRFEDLDSGEADKMVVREACCLIEIWAECLGRDVAQYQRRDALVLANALRTLGWIADPKPTRTKRFGLQKLFRRGEE